ncbi:unnamed protein product [Rotaria sp. Silwood1]|nr:unnamed protein product [Rotaria sp. Silwood1]CAF1484377.1 unnamed protein product [Rotaria sp. Silwood1]CAF1527056.1 unnamed protein product [Rotaria sp. Silwood1]CAF3660181.1 unnamed protein product [Rotaria sp. Silwood1]CAF3666152.1 unnamed protein product [Rotaria sp. Silwood1]
MVLSNPVMQRIMINNHEWEVPNEPGWEEVIRDAEEVQQKYFSSCITVAECRQVVDQIRAVFARYPVSQKYLESNSNDANDIFSSIFKWG